MKPDETRELAELDQTAAALRDGWDALSCIQQSRILDLIEAMQLSGNSLRVAIGNLAALGLARLVTGT